VSGSGIFQKEAENMAWGRKLKQNVKLVYTF